VHPTVRLPVCSRAICQKTGHLLTEIVVSQSHLPARAGVPIEPVGNGDVTLQLDQDYAHPENLFMAALDFLNERPDYYLGSWVDHPNIKNVLYGF